MSAQNETIKRAARAIAHEQQGESMKHRRRLPFVALPAAVAALVIAAAIATPIASAHVASFASQQTVTFTSAGSGGIFSGQVSSELAACMTSRSISLYRGTGTPVDAVTTLTDAAGAWSRRATNLDGGDYYAVAA